MASLSNINGLFDVHSTGAILFSTSHGTSGQILRSNGNAAPTWVAASTVIGGPYLPIAGGTLTGATATDTGISLTVGGNLFVTGTSTLTGALSGSTGTFSGNVTGTVARFDTLNNNANSANIIYRSGTDTIVGNNANALVVEDGGNVGIGTISPAVKLHIKDTSQNGSITDTIPTWWGQVIERSYTSASNAALGVIGGTTAAGSGGFLYLGFSDDVGANSIGINNNPAAGTMVFEVNNSPRMVIQPAGNVGIGTASPVSKFEVNGSIKVTGITSNIGSAAGLSLSYDSGINYINTWASTPLITSTYNYQAFHISGSERMRVTDYGSLVVGNTPGTNANWGKIQCGGTITVGNSSGTYIAHGRISGDSDGMKLKGTSTGTYSDPQGVTIDGYNVGINTNSPNVGNAFGLVIRSWATLSRLVFWNSTSGEVSSRGQRISFSNANCIFENMESGYYAFKTGGSGANPSERARFNNVGQLLINATTSGYSTNNYGYNLGVRGIASQAFISIARSTQTLDTQGMIIGVDSNTGYLIMRDNLPLDFYNNNTFRMRIDTSGNVGIGNTNPYSVLDVDGVIANRMASQDPNFTVTVVGMTIYSGGSLQFTQGFAGTSAAGDTIVFRYNAASWKSWSLDYTFASTSGLVKGTIGGYNNNSGGGSNFFLINNFGITAVATGSGQNVIVTFTGNFGIHVMCDMRYSQGGGDAYPRSDRASLTYTS